jgi:membrane protein YqaA with SNARE-associated domain
MVDVFGWEVAEDFLWGVGLATVIAIGMILRERSSDPESYKLTTWMEWCGRFLLVGAALTIVGGVVGWRPVTAAGLVLILPIYPVAILGLVGKLDDIRSSVVREIKKR